MANYNDLKWGQDLSSKLYQALVWVNIDPAKLAANPAFDLMLEKLIAEKWDLNDFLGASKRLARSNPNLLIPTT